MQFGPALFAFVEPTQGQAQRLEGRAAFPAEEGHSSCDVQGVGCRTVPLHLTRYTLHVTPYTLHSGAEAPLSSDLVVASSNELDQADAMPERVCEHRDLAPTVGFDRAFESRAGIARSVDGAFDVV